MTTSFKSPTSLALAFMLSMGALTGLAQVPQEPIPPVVPPEQTNPAQSEMSWEDLKKVEFERREAFIAQIRAMHTRFEADIDQLRARYQETQATESQRKAMAELNAAETDFEEKLKALDNVTSETWETVKSHLLSSWLTLQEAFKRASPTT